MNVITPRLVRLHDRLTPARDVDAVWRINPRTGFLESRAGLSWTGVREYRTPTGLLRVLRRPEQVNAPGHLATLRRLPCCEGHPAGGVDVSATNHAELGVGWTGDLITVEDLGGYPRPVGDVTVSRASTIAKMVDRATWQQYLADFPEVSKLGITHGGAPKTGTSLGYNALWYSPYVDAEIVSERDDGSLVGEWLGPHGAEQYDIEHIIDPDCEVVQRLAASTGFNPKILGGNHHAVALAALGGRGGEQSELLRIVDSRDVIAGDPVRASTRVTLQIPGMPSRANEADPTDSSQIVAPQVLDQSHDVADESKNQSGAARAALRQQEHQTMKIEIGFGRDIVRALTKLGKNVPAPLLLTVDEVDADKLRSKLSEMEGMFGDLMEMVSEAKGEAKEAEDKYDGAVAEMKDMMPVAEAAAKVDEIKAMLAEAEKALAESKAAESEAVAVADVTKKMCDSLEQELAPIREAKLQAFRDEVVALGFAKDAVDACATDIAVKRLVVSSKAGERYGKTRDDGSFIAGDDLVSAAFDGVWATLAKQPAAAKPSSLASIPHVSTQRDDASNSNTNDPAPVSHTAAQVQSGMVCL